MKSIRLFFAFTAYALVMNACMSDLHEPDGAAADIVNYRITADIAGNPDPSTKTYMGELSGSRYPVYWSAGDELGLISDGVGVFTIESGSGTATATFGGNAASIVGPFPGTSIYPAGYPADKAFASTDGSGNLLVGSYLPQKQSYRTGTFDDNVYAMAGMSTDALHYDFHNLCGIIQLQIYAAEAGKHIRQVNLTGSDGETVAGGIGLKYDPETGEVVTSSNAWENGMALATYGDEAYTRVTIDFSGLKAAANSTDTDKDGCILLSTDSSNPTIINIAVIPQVFEHGFTVEMVDGDNFGSSFKYSVNGTTVKRSTLTRFEVFEYVAPAQLETANGYVYEEAGYYLMPAYAMGNRLDLKVVPTGVDHDNLAVDLLWSDMVDTGGNLLPAVTNIDYIRFDDGNDMIQFKVNNIDDDPAKGPYRGNAVIALYDKTDNTIFWSWHLWLGNYKDVIVGGTCADGSYDGAYPDGTAYEYRADATTGKMIIMDRNLGAISADPSDGWKTYGLLYQNGRKDPFPGADYDRGTVSADTRTAFTNEEFTNVHIEEGGATLSSEVSAASAFTVGMAPKIWYNAELAPEGWIFHNGYYTITQTIRKPMSFSTGYFTNKNGQWTWFKDTDNMMWMDPKLKGGESGNHGNTGLQPYGHEAYWNRTKTIFDPCPAGYSVLGERDGKFFNKDTKTAYSSSPYGYMSTFTYGGTPYNTWWPAAGVRTSSGQLGDVGYTGLYFFFDHMENTHGGHGMSFTVGGGKGGNFETDQHSNHAGSIRCVRAKQFDGSGNPSPALKQ